MKGTVTAVVALGLLIVAFSSTYTINEVQQVIITQFGEPIGDPITEPGLHFKLPIVQKVNRFDKRWLEWDGSADEMPTKEKTYIWVDAYARWRIMDPLQFFKRVGDERAAQSRLDDIIDSETRNVIATYELKEVVRLTNRALPEAVYDVQLPDTIAADDVPGESVDQQIEMGRDKLTRMILEKAQKAMPDYGIELVDLQFQRVNYTDTVEKKVFKRMISERKRIAALYRSEGMGMSARIRGEMDRELKTIESEAYRTVQEIQGDADARATAIYADAHGRDPYFYKLVKSLESYKTTLGADTTMVLSTDSDFYSTLTEMGR